MPLFQWNPLFETGNQRIDDQHRKLFELTNRLAHAVQNGENLPTLAVLVAELRDYAATHFCDEEQLMRCSALTHREIERHACVHASFIEKVDEVAARTDLSDEEATGAFLELLITWLVTHILKLDRRVARALVARVAEPAEDNVSAEQVLVAALMETEKRFRMLSDEAPSLIWISGASGRRDFANRPWFDLVGAEVQPASAVDWAGFIHPDDRRSYAACIAEVLASGHTASLEFRVRTSSGGWAWVREKISPRTNRGRCIGLIAAATDITEIKQSEDLIADASGRVEREVSERTQQLQQLALVDPLTGLPNRRALLERIDADVAHATGHGDALSLLFVDVDRFKRINDSFGHAAGDSTLIEVAAVIKGSLRGSDFVGRLGGEEFVAVLPSTALAGAEHAAETIRRKVAEHGFRGVDGGVTVSIGIASLQHAEDGAALLARADHAMLRAKRSGRNRCCAAEGENLDRLSA